MLTKSRTTLAAALAVVAFGAVPAQGMPIDRAQQLDMHASTVEQPADARGEHAAAQSDVVSTTAQDHRTADAREPFVRPVVVEVGEPVSDGFDWTAGIAGLAGGLALALLASIGVSGARRRQVRTIG